MPEKIALEEVNRLGKDGFVAKLGGVFEHSPWIAERSWHERPFGGPSELQDAFLKAMYEAPAERQISLIRAHPDLAGRAAVAGELTPESTREQASAGLDRLSPEEYETFHRLNTA